MTQKTINELNRQEDSSIPKMTKDDPGTPPEKIADELRKISQSTAPAQGNELF